MDEHSKEKLSKVHPLLAEKVEALLSILGGDVRVVSGLRTYAEQDALYAQGRTKPGNRVTNARGGQSNHNFALAIDLCPFTDGKPDWDNNAEFNRIGVNARAVGLEWGGDWAHIIDKPHVQLKGLTVRECRDLHAKGGMPAVWKRASEINKSDIDIPISEQTSASQGEPEHHPDFDRDLHFGDKGADVRALQVKLGVTVDGDFGWNTKQAVLNLQHKSGMREDGIVGPNTRAKLGL